MLYGLRSAFAFLTILPVTGFSSLQPGKMFSFFPLVGLVIGVIVSVVASIVFLPRELTAFLALAAWVGMTGGLHLDGLADACDGLLATTSPERRLEIMKDPRAGSWAVIGVVLMLLGKWTALRTLPPAFLLVPPIVGRWSMVLAAAAFPSARSSGLAAQFRVGFGRTQVFVASLTTILLIVALSVIVDARLSLSLIVAPITVFVFGRWAAKRLGGGLTGDVYGALCELVELLCLICLNIT